MILVYNCSSCKSNWEPLLQNGIKHFHFNSPFFKYFFLFWKCPWLLNYRYIWVKWSSIWPDAVWILKPFLVIFAFWPLEWRILSCVFHLLHYIIRLGPNYVQVIRFCTKKKENSWVFTTGWKLKYDLITLTIIGPILFILVFIFNVGDTSLENVSGNC